MTLKWLPLVACLIVAKGSAKNVRHCQSMYGQTLSLNGAVLIATVVILHVNIKYRTQNFRESLAKLGGRNFC